jgi:hypothetical protein
LREVAIADAMRSPIGKPFSATSIAGCRTCANDIVPQRSSSRYHASTTPGTVPDSSVSLCGSLPSRFFLYQSMVASFWRSPFRIDRHDRLGLGVVDEDDCVAADAVGRSVDEPRTALTRNRGVERVAAGHQDAFCRLGRLRLHRGGRLRPPRTTGRIVDIRILVLWTLCVLSNEACGTGRGDEKKAPDDEVTRLHVASSNP